MDAQDAQDATEEHIYECALAALLAEDSTAADVRPTLQKFCDSPQALEESSHAPARKARGTQGVLTPHPLHRSALRACRALLI